MAITDVSNSAPLARVSPVLTSLVLGIPTPIGSAADMFFPRVIVDGTPFNFRKYDSSELVPHETRRAFSAPFKFAEPTAQLLEASLERHSFAGRADADQIKLAAGVGGDPKFQSRRSAIGRKIVNLSRELAAADLLTATGSYPSGHVITLTSGSEWDSAGGDSNSDIGAAAALILAKTAVARTQLKVGLSATALAAALQDPVFKNVRQYTNSKFPSVADLAAYWGVGEVFTFNPIYTTDADSDTVPLPIFGDVAIVFVPVFDPSSYDKENGDMVFGAGFAWNQGVANVPFYHEMTTSWYYPWTDWFRFEIISGAAGVLIKNCAA